MRRMPGLRLLLIAVAALLLAGCGGDESSTTAAVGAPESAAVAPADVAFYVSVDTDFAGEQWQRVNALVDKFPSGDELGQEFRDSLAEDDVDWDRDLKPALGPEVAFMGWQLDGEAQFVMVTRSPQPAELRALLAKSDDPVVTSEVGGWTVAAERQADIDRFTSGQGSAKLEGQQAFKDGLAEVGEDALAIAYVGGPELQRAIDEGTAGEGLPPGLTGGFGSLQAIVLGTSAESDGVRFGAVLDTDGGPEQEPYSPSLDEVVPARPILFVSSRNLEEGGRTALAEAAKQPTFQQQRSQLEKLVGLSLEDDILPLLGGEIAIAVYSGASGQLPVTIDLLLEVDDEDEARRVMDRLGALAELGAGGRALETKVGELDATELQIQGMSIVWAVADGRLMITTGREALEALQAGTPRLADDEAYTAALDRAEAPDEVIGLVYSDLEALVPLALGFAGGLDPEVRANLEPLRSALLFGTADGDDVTVSGFVGID